MKTATAISIPTAPVLPAIRHIFFTSGSMAGVPVSRRGLEIKAARTHVARTVATRAVGRPATPGTTLSWGASGLGPRASDFPRALEPRLAGGPTPEALSVSLLQLRDVGQAAVGV